MDWHGVLSEDPYWASILRRSVRKGLRTALEGRLVEIFESGRGLSDDWMRGRLDTADLFAPVNQSLTRRERPDFLERRIVHDCMNMMLDSDLVTLLKEYSETLRIVMATDNTEDFERAFHTARFRRRNHDRPPDKGKNTLRDVACCFDGIICSSNRGVLKAEDADGFFGEWLEESGLTFADAALIDDRRDNCAAFQAAGGQAILWDTSTSAARAQSLKRLTAWVRATESIAAGSQIRKLELA